MVESQIRRPSVGRVERVYGGECEWWRGGELQKAKLRFSQLACKLCRFDSPPRHVLSLYS